MIPNPTSNPTVAEIAAARDRLGDLVRETPVHQWLGPEIEALAGPGTAVFLKLELLQFTGTFKPRGALTVMLNLPADKLAQGVTAVSAGNHAIATAYAAQTLGYEFCRQVAGLDAVIVPIGGGGLIAGVAAAVKRLQPEALVFGVEPEGAD